MPPNIGDTMEVDGVKRHVLVDSAGALVAIVVTEADVQDRAAFPKLLCEPKRIAHTLGSCLEFLDGVRWEPGQIIAGLVHGVATAVEQSGHQET